MNSCIWPPAIFGEIRFGSEAKAMFRQFFGREPDGNVSALTLVDMSDRHVWNPVTRGGFLRQNGAIHLFNPPFKARAL